MREDPKCLDEDLKKMLNDFEGNYFNYKGIKIQTERGIEAVIETKNKLAE